MVSYLLIIRLAGQNLQKYNPHICELLTAGNNFQWYAGKDTNYKIILFQHLTIPHLIPKTYIKWTIHSTCTSISSAVKMKFTVSMHAFFPCKLKLWFKSIAFLSQKCLCLSRAKRCSLGRFFSFRVSNSGPINLIRWRGKDFFKGLTLHYSIYRKPSPRPFSSKLLQNCSNALMDQPLSC